MTSDAMRLLYIDIDSLRPDHLGCYGYHRATSPNIDALASGSGAVRFTNCYASDVPCLRKLGYRTTTISSFGERHAAFHWYAGFGEIINPGQCGLERADEVTPIVL